MKKFLLSAVAVCAAIGGGGYLYSVHQFEKEAENFKESLMASDIFKTKSVVINKYKLQIVLDGMIVDVSKYLQQLNTGENQHVPSIQLQTDASITFCYTPLIQKIKMAFPQPTQTGVIRVDSHETKLELTDKTRYLEFYLSHTPTFKDKSLGDFLKHDVSKIAATAKDYVLKVNGSDAPLATLDEIHLLLTREKVDQNDKITFDYDVKGGDFHSDEMYKVFEPLIPAVPGGPNLKAMYMPVSGLEDAKRDMRGQVRFVGDIHKIITATLESRNQSDFFKVLEGVSFEANSQDKMLNSEANAEVNFKLEKPGSEISEIKYRVEGIVSPELQVVLPKAIHQRFIGMFPEIKLSEQDIQDLLPNFAAWGKSLIDLDFKGNIGRNIGDGYLDISLAGYEIKVTAKSTADNILVSVKIKNYEELINSLEAYALKIANHPSMQTMIVSEQKAMIPSYVELAKSTLKSMGKEEVEGGKPVIIIEQTIPTAVIGALAGNSE